MTKLKYTIFVPVVPRYFILEIPGIDSFLIKSVQKAAFVANENLTVENDIRKRLHVVLHNTANPHAENQIDEIINSGNLIKEVKLFLMDALGNVMATETYHNVVIDMVEYDLLTYESSKPVSEIKISLRYGHKTLL